MRIERKIVFSNLINLVLIVAIGSFAISYLNSISEQATFLSIADSLNASFLEMRLSEKNYFLFNDNTALKSIQDRISQTQDQMNSVRDDIVRVIGQDGYNELQNRLNSYSAAVSQAGATDARDPQTEETIREAGRQLKDSSDAITGQERQHIEHNITRSKELLLLAIGAVFVSALVVSRSISGKIIGPIRQIERLAKSISAGNFKKIEAPIPRDEFGPVIEAINSMSEELEEREEEIIQSKKLASMGVLVAGVAHELNNPVNNISMVAQAYDELYDKLTPQQRREFMQKVDRETGRIKKIVDNLLDYGKPKEPNPREVGINSVIGKSMQLVQNTLNISKIETTLDLAEGLPELFVDDNQIQQVLINLILNAAQAMEEGGRLTVKSSLDRERGMVDITVADTGKGIPAEYLPYIFDPFFSVKEEGGTGLGLSVSFGIIKSHGGNIRVDSKAGIGTTFTVELPVPEEKGTT